jgi:hypothetical protein
LANPRYELKVTIKQTFSSRKELLTYLIHFDCQDFDPPIEAIMNKGHGIVEGEDGFTSVFEVKELL